MTFSCSPLLNVFTLLIFLPLLSPPPPSCLRAQPPRDQSGSGRPWGKRSADLSSSASYSVSWPTCWASPGRSASPASSTTSARTTAPFNSRWAGRPLCHSYSTTQKDKANSCVIGLKIYIYIFCWMKQNKTASADRQCHMAWSWLSMWPDQFMKPFLSWTSAPRVNSFKPGKIFMRLIEELSQFLRLLTGHSPTSDSHSGVSSVRITVRLVCLKFKKPRQYLLMIVLDCFSLEWILKIGLRVRYIRLD